MAGALNAAILYGVVELRAAGQPNVWFSIAQHMQPKIGKNMKKIRRKTQTGQYVADLV